MGAWHHGKRDSLEGHSSGQWLQVTLNSAALWPPDTQWTLNTGNENEGKAFFAEFCGLEKSLRADLFCLLRILKDNEKTNRADSPSPCHAWSDLIPSKINAETPAALRGGRISPRDVIQTLIQVTPKTLRFTDQNYWKFWKNSSLGTFNEYDPPLSLFNPGGRRSFFPCYVNSC